MICTPAEVFVHAGRATFTAAEEAAVASQIALYQAELEGVLGRGVERTTRTEARTLRSGAERFDVRRGPVHAVTGLSVGGLEVVSGDYEVDRNGVALPIGYHANTTVSITYEGGWDAPDNLPAKGAVLGRTARWLSKRTDDDVGTESSSVEGHSVKWMADDFTAAELRACDRLRNPDQAG